MQPAHKAARLISNGETAKKGNLQYFPKSLSNKRFAGIVLEICKLPDNRC